MVISCLIKMANKYKIEEHLPNIDLFKKIKVDGFNMTRSFVEGREMLDNWIVDEEDVWIAGLPKAGTTWTQEMVWLLVNDLNYEEAKNVSIQERSPQWEDSTFLDIRPIGAARNVEIPLFRADSLRFIKENKQKGKPMCIKSHLAFNFLPKQIRDGSKKPKVVLISLWKNYYFPDHPMIPYTIRAYFYLHSSTNSDLMIVIVSRNPKDTCVSMYHFQRNIAGLKSSLEDFAQDYIDQGAFFGPPWDHIISYWKERHRPNLLILRYEEMITDLPGVLRKVAAFLEKKFTDDQFQEVAEHLSFKSMKDNTAVNFTNLFQLSEKLGASSGGGNFLRSGKVGSYKEELSPEIIKKFDEISSEKAKESGWNFF